MDCEQFDQIVLDVLYGELSDSDELAAARRHMDRCERCAGLLTNLRAARRSAAMPLEVPPAGVRGRAMDVARAAQRQMPWHHQVGRWVSVAGSYAMRPQLAMAALLLLMIGSSLLLLRGRPGSGQVDVVHVTEQGVPERDPVEESPTAVPERLEPLAAASGAASDHAGSIRAADSEVAARDARKAPKAGLSGDAPASTSATDQLLIDEGQRARRDQRATAAARPAEDGQGSGNLGSAASGANDLMQGDYAAAMAMYNAGDFANAYRAFDNVAQAGGANAASAMLYAAKAVRNSSGCTQSLPRFESVMGRFVSTNAGIQARWEAAACARILGDYVRARQYLNELAQLESQRERAEAEIARLTPSRGQNQNAQRAPAAAPASNRAQQQRPSQRTEVDRSNAY